MISTLGMIGSMMKDNHALVRFGALSLALALIGYALYELVLLPRAGFPSDDMRVILAGADTLRVGHWLKFVYGSAIAIVMAGLTVRLYTFSATVALLALVAGSASVLFYIASGMLGLRILDVAQGYSPANMIDARTTILIRVVTQSLQSAGTFTAGWFVLLISLGAWRVGVGLLPRWLNGLGVVAGLLLVPAFILPDPIWLIGPLLMIGYAGALAVVATPTGKPSSLQG